MGRGLFILPILLLSWMMTAIKTYAQDLVEASAREEGATMDYGELKDKSFHDIVHHQPTSWFESDAAQSLADSLMRYQLPNGGWPKNQQWHKGAEHEVMTECQESGIGTTIDNGATMDEMEYLRRVYLATGESAYRNAFLRGVFYLLDAQYDNGGWPQFFPLKNGYYNHITFNDGAMTGVMYILKGIGKNQPRYSDLEIDEHLRARCLEAYLKGIDCILKCQIVKKGKRTVWCQQHDELTLEPAPARSYELASLSGFGETESILRLLMAEEDPSDEIREAIAGAKEWLRTHAIRNTIVEHFTNQQGKPDIRLKKKKGAPLLWARFYDLDTEKPFFCDRDGVVRDDLSKISYERRMGYSWVSDSPGKLIE